MSDKILSLADLKTDKKNARKHNPRNIGMIETSLRQVGAARSGVIDEDGVILAGNGTYEALASAGIERVRVVETDGKEWVVVKRTGLSEEQKRQLALADNRAAELATWDAPALEAQGIDLNPWFTPDELANLKADGQPGGNEEAEDPGPQIDKAEELRKKWQVEVRQLWQLGEHRLLCGDSTKREDVERVMGGEKAQLVYTDPPYGVNYDGGTTMREKLAGDTNTDLYLPTCQMAFAYSDEKAPLYIWHAGVKGIAAAAAAAAAGYEIRCELVWNKNVAQFGALSAQYKQKHEPCYYCFKRGKAPRWFGPTNEVTVWDCNRASVNEFHPTQKPVELAERALKNSSEMGDIIAEWFLGSGATLIACERLGRQCRAIEISPAYVAVALQRWSDMTKQEPRLL